MRGYKLSGMGGCFPFQVEASFMSFKESTVEGRHEKEYTITVVTIDDLFM